MNGSKRERTYLQRRRALGHAPGAATGAKAPSFVAERHKVLGTAGVAAYPQKTPLEAAASKVLVNSRSTYPGNVEYRPNKRHAGTNFRHGESRHLIFGVRQFLLSFGDDVMISYGAVILTSLLGAMLTLVVFRSLVTSRLFNMNDDRGAVFSMESVRPWHIAAVLAFSTYTATATALPGMMRLWRCPR